MSLAFGLSLLAMAYAIGPISGCHINPAVTVGMLLSKEMDAKYAVGYFIEPQVLISARQAERALESQQAERNRRQGRSN